MSVRQDKEGSLHHKKEPHLQKEQLSVTSASDMLGFSSIHSAMFWRVAMELCFESKAQWLFHFQLGGGELVIIIGRLWVLTKWIRVTWDLYT